MVLAYAIFGAHPTMGISLRLAMLKSVAKMISEKLILAMKKEFNTLWLKQTEHNRLG
jgi:hypothetical protein